MGLNRSAEALRHPRARGFLNKEGTMSHTSRLMRRPFYWLMAMMVAGGMAWPNGALRAAASPAPQSGPALTTVSDTVYRADGSPAQGRLEITWPTFIAAGGSAVAAGTA